METVPVLGFRSARQEGSNSPELSQKALCELDDENNHMSGEPALNTPWTFWFDRAPKGTSAQDYFANLKKIFTVNTVKAFWCVYNNLRSVDQLKEGESYHLMRGADRRPVWEDSNNADGGRWTFRCKRDHTSTTWLELLLAAIGEGFADHVAEGDDVIGISVKVRGSEHTVFQVWNQTIQARDQSKVMLKVKELLQSTHGVLDREKYESNREHLVHSMMKPTYHKSAPHQGRFAPPFQPQANPPLQPPFRAQGPLLQQQPGAQQQSPTPHSPVPILPHPPVPILPHPQGAQAPPPWSTSPKAPEPHLPTPPSPGAQCLLPEPPPPSHPGVQQPPPPPGVQQPPPATIQPPFVGAQYPHPWEIPSSTHTEVAQCTPAGTATFHAPRFAAPSPFPMPQPCPPQEVFRYRHPPPPVQRFPGPHGYQPAQLGPTAGNAVANAAPL